MKISNKIIILFLVIILNINIIPTVFANSGITVLIDNEPITLNDPCIISDGTVYLPMQELFLKVGIKMEWSSIDKCWMGKGNNGEIRINKDMMTAEIDWVDIDLPAPIKEIEGKIYVPLYLIEDAWRTDPATYDEKTQTVHIKSPELNFKPAFTEIDVASVAATLPKGDELWKPEWLESITVDNDNPWVKVSTVDVEGMHFDKACRIETVLGEDGKYYSGALYGAQAHKIIAGTGDFTAGDVGIYSFWARATKTTDETGKAFMRACLEQTEKWQKACEDTILIDSQWRHYFVPMYQPNYTLYDGAMHLCFSVGAKPQIIEISDIHLINYHHDVEYTDLRKTNTADYKGIEEDALWRKEAYRRIDKYRRDDMVIYVKDENGDPVEGAKITADMKKNEFPIGIAVLDDEWVFEEKRNKESRINDLKMTVYKDCFNTFCDALDLVNPKDDYRNAVRLANSVMEQGLMQRGHCTSYLTFDLNYMRQWPSGNTDAAVGMNAVNYNDAYNFMRDYCIGKIWLFKHVERDWNVANEFYFTPAIKQTWGTQMWSDMFKLQKALDPTARTYLCETGFEGAQDRNSFASGIQNDFLTNTVYPMVEDERAPIDGIAVQGHCAQYLYPQGMYHQIDALSQRFNSVAITEYDFANADQSHAFEHMRDTFLTVFSHPKGDEFILWGYYDPWHWRQKAPFFDERWNDKSGCYAKWKEYYNDVLNPTEYAVTDADGKALIHTFRGDFDITVETEDAKGTTKFCLTDSDVPDRDNRIDAIVSGKEIKITHTNPLEFYSEPVKFRTASEALSDYRMTMGDRELIGIFNHCDQDGNFVRNINDGLQNTYWYGNGDGAFISLELVEKAAKGDICVDFRAVNNEDYNVKVLVSEDGENWKEIYTGSSTQMGTIPFENAMFIKIQSVGNKYMGISEVTINAEK